MKHTDLSLDLETLGTKPGSAITQIGVCAFSRERGGAANFFVDPQSCMDKGMTVTWSTIKWWLMQSEKSRAEMASDRYCLPIGDALFALGDWLTEHMANDFRIWGHGSNFDVVLLEHAYAVCHVKIPWHYRNIRDLRTLVSFTPEVEKPISLVEHLAMEDAIAQANWIMRARNKLDALNQLTRLTNVDP